MRTSYSALETYLQCPQRYKFQNIDKIRGPKSKEAIFGTLIHSTLHFMFQKDPLFPTLEEVVSHFREKWPSPEIFQQETRHDPLKRGWTDDEQKIYFEEGVRMIKKFYERNAPWNFHVLDLESRFEVSLMDETTGEVHILAGIMDRVDKLSDGTYEIIDYKTSKRMPSQTALDENLQLSLYSLGLQKRWPHLSPETIRMSLYFLKHGEKLSTSAKTETIQKTKEKILQIIREIEDHKKSGKPFEPMPSALCNWCSYRPICPAWKHLYKNNGQTIKDKNDIEKIITEYFDLKKSEHKNKARLIELQEHIRQYMDQEGLTRVFGDEGFISKKTQRRFEYDTERIKELLSPLGKWEKILKADETKLKKILKEIPEDVRKQIENSRTVSREFITLTASLKKIEKPDTAPPSSEI